MFLRRFARWLVAAVALVAAVLSVASPLAAHTGFESSTPSDGDAVDGVVSEVVIRFTGEATPTGEGFTVLDPSGVTRRPSAVTTADNKVFVLGFDPPLAEGRIGVRWMVQAQDSHPIEGSFSFTVTAPTSTTAATPEPAESASPDSATTTVAPSATEGSGVASAGGVPDTSEPASGDGDPSGTSLEEFLATDSSTPGEGRQLVGRIGSFLGVIGALGGLAFLGFALRGTRREIDGVLTAVAGLGALTAAAAGIEYWGWLAQAGGSVIGELTSTPGAAMALRAVGGVVVAGSIAAARWPASDARRGSRPTRSLSAAVTQTPPTTAGESAAQRWRPGRAPVVLAGAALLVVSFWFDGHTVSKGPHVVHPGVNSVHVVAAAVWAGGVMALLGVLMTRRRRGQPGRAAELVTRFSSVAAVASAAVVLAGAVMAVLVLDSPSELTTTEWGRTLLLKTGAVGIAMLAGAYNHFRLRPQLEAAPDDGRLEAELRWTLVAEAIVLTFVVVATAWLVAAATGAEVAP